MDPESRREVRLLQGPYGWYLEQEAPASAAAAAKGEPNNGGTAKRGRGRKAAAPKPKRKRVSLGRSASAPSISLAEALDLLQWPKVDPCLQRNLAPMPAAAVVHISSCWSYVIH